MNFLVASKNLLLLFKFKIKFDLIVIKANKFQKEESLLAREKTF